MSFIDDQYGRQFSSGAKSNNDASVLAYGAPRAGEPLERARRRAAGVGPLSNHTGGLPVWVVADRQP